MAFQMIPPRLSSSPPPLDSLPPVTCPGVDEDDEFDHFSSHNASFDITVKEARPEAPCLVEEACAPNFASMNDPQHNTAGLSDKLPPTPESSPSRFPGIRLGPSTERGLTEGLEGTLEDSISQDSGVDSSNHPHEFSPQPQGDNPSREDLGVGDGGRVDRELSDIEQNDVDDFGDFQAGNEVPGEESVGERQDWDGRQISSQPESESSKCEDSEPSRYRAIGSPPPLDCVAKDTVIEDGFSSSFPPPDDDDDDDDVDFGNFASHEVELDLPSGASTEKCSMESSLHPSDSQAVPANKTTKSDHIETASSPGVHQITSATERLQADGDSEGEDSTCTPNKARNVEGEDSKEEQKEDTHLGSHITSEVTQTPAEDERGAADGMATSQNNAGENSGDSTVVAPITSASNDDTDAQQRTGDKSGLYNDSAVPESDQPVPESDAREMVPASDDTEHDVCGSENDNESDFGDFNQADDDDDDDLDFADLRKQVEDGTFGEINAECGDFSAGFGDFGDGNEGGDDGDDFGEFGDFGDFTASADIDAKAEFSNFGDFVVHSEEGVVEDDFSQNIDDDFGDFSAPENSGALRGFTAAPVEEKPQFPTQDGGVCKTSPILQKLESLITKWIPRAAAPQEDSCPVPLLHQAIESDAFVWRQLENLESSAALRLSWSTTQAHNLFLSSVNVDARNILFGQKWSSSVPLFAQTLSFSPLTPAKSTEGAGAGGGGGGSGGVGLAGTSKELPPDTFPSTTTKHTQHNKKNSTTECSSVSANGGSEEQIPPAKFDWTSSGLTNPLEGPAYSSSLFGLDLLLTNTKIGKGATNALLASLEQEFLSEGGDKGSGGRAAKSPPTPSPLVQQILGGGMSKVPSPATPLQSLEPEVRQVVTQLPNLSFMRSRVLMFPIRGDQ